MITSLYKANPFDDELFKKIADYASRTNNQNLINYYQNIRISYNEKLKWKTIIITKPFF